MPVFVFPQPGVDDLVDELDLKGGESGQFSAFVVEDMVRTVERDGDMVVVVTYRITARNLAAAEVESPEAVDRLKQPDPVGPVRP